MNPLVRSAMTLAALVLGSTAVAGGLSLGSVLIPIGSPAEPTVARLRESYSVRAMGAAWEVRSSKPGDPLVLIGARDGLIVHVSHLWSPNVQPSLEEMTKQLAQALPTKRACTVENDERKGEGGVGLVRTLVFTCGKETARFQTSFWQGGGSASMSVDLK